MLQKTIKQKKDEVAALTPEERARLAEEDRLAKIETDKTKVTQEGLDKILQSGQDVFRGKNIQALSAQEQTGQKAADVIVGRQRQIIASQQAPQEPPQQPNAPQTVKESGVTIDAQGNRFVMNPRTGENLKLPMNQEQFQNQEALTKNIDTGIARTVQIGAGAIAIGAVAPLIASSVSATEISALSVYSKAKAVFLGVGAVAGIGVGVEHSINLEVGNVQKDNTDIIEAVSKGGMSGGAAFEALEKNTQSLAYLEKAAHISNMADWKRLVGLGGAVERKIITTQRDTENKKEIVRQMILAGTIPL